MGSLLVERERELAALDALLARAREGQGGALLLQGPPGIGKSSLLEAVATTAAGSTILRGRGGELERAFAFGVVRQLFERHLHAATPEARARWLDGPAALAGSVLGVGTAVGADEPSLLHALHWLVVQLAADGPLVLVLDDLHWADDGSVRFATYLVRRLEGLPVAVLAASRPWDPAAPAELLAAFEREPEVEVVRPAPLSARATREVVAEELGGADAAFGHACHEACGGNPLLLSELLAEARAAGVDADAEGAERVAALASAGLQRSVADRVRALGPFAVAIAQAMAVLGDDVELEDAAALAGVEAHEAAAAVRALADVDVLRTGRPLAMSHPLLRAAILADLGPVAEAALHARAARLLHERGAPAERVAAHLEKGEGEPGPWAVDVLAEAAGQARDRGALPVAARLLERALALESDAGRRTALRVELGSVLVVAGEIEGIPHLLAARDAIDDPRVRCTLALQAFGLPMWMVAEPRRVVDLLEEATAEAREAVPDLVVPLLAARTVAAVQGSGESVSRLRDATIAEARRRGGRDPATRAALAFMSAAHMLSGDHVDDAVALAWESIVDADHHREAIDQGWPMVSAVVALAYCDVEEGVDEAFARIEEGARRRGALGVGLAACCSFRAMAHLRRGDLAAAIADAETALEVGARNGVSTTYGMAALAGALAEQGRAVEALDAMARTPAVGAGLPTGLVLGSRAKAMMELRRPEEALAAAQQAGAIARASDADGPGWFAWRSIAAEALLQLGRADEAAALAREELRLAEQFGAPGPIGLSRRALGLATDDVDLLLGAVGSLARSTCRLEHARAQIDLGAALRRRGERTAAREPLAAGMETAHRCGAVPLTERAREELLASGARPRKPVRTGRDALTTSEHRVARLAAEGLTNREIAQQLFVSPKTVESQLRAAFRKLDVAARTDLAAALDDASG